MREPDNRALRQAQETFQKRAEARQMRVCRASSGGHSGGQGPTRDMNVVEIGGAPPTKILGAMTSSEVNGHRGMRVPAQRVR